jgi:hypothetical protein
VLGHLGDRHDRTIDEAERRIRKASVDIDRTCPLADGRRRVGECATREILHEVTHRAALVARPIEAIDERSRDASGEEPTRDTGLDRGSRRGAEYWTLASRPRS